MARLQTVYAFAVVFSSMLCLSVAHAQYTIIDLGAITANGQSRGYGVNNLGEVAGWSDGHAFFWTKGVMIDLGVLSGTTSEGRDVNDLGQVVGWSDAPQARHAFIWQDRNGNRQSDPGEMVDLRPIPNTWQGRAYGINNGGHVAGWSAINPDGVYHAFRWSYNQGGWWDWYDLGNITGNPDEISLANDINNLGQVVGGSGSSGSRRAFRTQPYAAINVFSPKLNADGTFDLILTPTTYTLAFKADRSLRRVLTGISLPAGTLAVNLVNGDADGDNEVSLFDFGRLVSAFGKLEGEPGFDPTADFDGDGEISLFDFGILVRNFGQVGDE